MNISSVIVRPRPGKAAGVRAALSTLDGVEVHAEDTAGRLIVTLEDSNVATAADRYAGLHHIPGVLSATLIYQYSDDADIPSVPVSPPNPLSEEVSP